MEIMPTEESPIQPTQLARRTAEDRAAEDRPRLEREKRLARALAARVGWGAENSGIEQMLRMSRSRIGVTLSFFFC